MHFYIQRKGKNTKSFHIPGFNKLDIGIAMSHFELTMNGRGVSGKWFVENPIINYTGENRPIYICSWKKE